MAEKFRRTQYLNDLSLQMRYMAVNFFVLLLFLTLSIWIIYVTGWVHMVERLSQIYPQGRLTEILRLIYLRLAIGFLLILPVVFLATLFLSHTVAGPLVRIKRYLRLMAKGEFDLAPLVLRKYDELQEVADLINEISAKQGNYSKERRKLIASLQTTVQSLRSDIQRLSTAGQEVHRKVDFLVDSLKVL